jgi:hypothetical protein
MGISLHRYLHWENLEWGRASLPGISVRRVPAGVTWRRGSFTGDFERKVRFGRGSSVTRDCQRYVKECSGNIASLCGSSAMGTWRGRDPLLGTLKDV